MIKTSTIPILISIASITIVQASDPVSIEESNSRDGVSVSVSIGDGPVAAGKGVEFQITYRFQQSGRYMNIFALTHNHPRPTAEIRLFRPDGSFYGIVRAGAFAGNFPDHEYLMRPNSSITFRTTISTAIKADVHAQRISPRHLQGTDCNIR